MKRNFFLRFKRTSLPEILVADFLELLSNFLSDLLSPSHRRLVFVCDKRKHSSGQEPFDYRQPGTHSIEVLQILLESKSSACFFKLKYSRDLSQYAESFAWSSISISIFSKLKLKYDLYQELCVPALYTGYSNCGTIKIRLIKKSSIWKV